VSRILKTAKRAINFNPNSLCTMNVGSYSTALDLRSVDTCLAHLLIYFTFRDTDSFCSLLTSYLILGLHTTTRQTQQRRSFRSTVHTTVNVNVRVVSSTLMKLNFSQQTPHKRLLDNVICGRFITKSYLSMEHETLVPCSESK
jgi:hypothetical protein